MIQIDHLTKIYHKKTAVDDLSFKVETGRVTGFLGPNGAGKSTTMRLMLGLDSGRGTTTFEGKRLTDYNRPSSIVGILLEAKAFHPTRSAQNHLKVLAAAEGVEDKMVAEALNIVGLADLKNSKPGKFSLGMSQRLGIAAAILSKPKYLILDEPANGLDPEGIAWLRQFIKDYADQGNGVLVSSHLLNEMSRMADDIVVIGKGKLIADTSMESLLSGSQHRRVFTRVDKPLVLEKLLNSKKLKYQKQDNGYEISAVQSDELGKMIFSAGLTVLELMNQSASLEEAFLELTADTEEFRGKKP